jgi:Recombination endonuclease VII
MTKEEARRSRSRSMKRQWKDPKFRAAHARALSKKMKQCWQDPDWRARLLSRINREKTSATMRERRKTGPVDPRMCEICGGKQVRGYSLARDHDHITGKARGLLCGRCNVSLGFVELTLRGLQNRKSFNNSEAWQFSALRYLKKYGTGF